jgi:hypothetical protein
MFKFYYPVRIKSLLIAVIFWSAWMAGWIWAPPEELVWAPIKWVFIVVFAPIGVILLGAISGYKAEFDQQTLKVGFFPFIRRVDVSKLTSIKKGSVYPLTVWKTTEFVILEFKTGKPFSFPCNDADQIVETVKRFIN